MQVIPAIDLMDGKCVRLIQGDPSKKKVYSDNPVDIAKHYKIKGAKLIHLIDLDAALGFGQNVNVVRKILNIPINAQVGGGIKTLDKAESLLKLGASKIIFGTIAIKNPKIVKEAVCTFGSKHVAVAIDERGGKVTLQGWRELTNINYLELALSLEEIGVGSIILTTTNVDGTLKGPAVKKIKEIVGAIQIPVIASGGVGNLKDLTILASIGVYGVIIGTALYEHKFTFEEALGAAENVS